MFLTIVGGKDPKLSTSGKLPKVIRPQTEHPNKPHPVEGNLENAINLFYFCVC